MLIAYIVFVTHHENTLHSNKQTNKVTNEQENITLLNYINSPIFRCIEKNY